MNGLENVYSRTFKGMRSVRSLFLPMPEQERITIMAIRIGTNGNDTLEGTNQNDEIWGRGGDDRLDGNGGHDMIGGSTGRDSLYGGHGNDTLYGHDNNDRLRGNHGDDILYGGSGKDQLDGGPGNDTLFGGTGNDRLTGGDGNDRFVFFPNHGRDKISNDFNIYGDRIQLRGDFDNVTLSLNNPITLLQGASVPAGVYGYHTLTIDTGSGRIDISGIFSQDALTRGLYNNIYEII